MEKRERWDSTNGRLAETGSPACLTEIERKPPRLSFAKMRVHQVLNPVNSRTSSGGFLRLRRVWKWWLADSPTVEVATLILRFTFGVEVLGPI